MKPKKDLKIEDFQETTYVSYKQIERVMGKRMFKQFMKFMFGRTIPADYCPRCKRIVGFGVYPWNLENFFRPKNKRFFD